jgi:MOSC domain-containing protein YiiM
MGRPPLIVDHWTYEGTDAHRTLLNLGDLWMHHLHQRAVPNEAQIAAADELAALFVQLTEWDDASLSPQQRVSQLGTRSAERIDMVDTTALTSALRGMWQVLSALAGAQVLQRAEQRTPDDDGTQGVVSGLFLSDGGVPKSAVDTVDVGFRGVIGDRQASRVHHGRPWQALCLWSDDIVRQLAQDGHPIRPGSAGENVSVRRCDWTSLRPGMLVTMGGVRATITAYAIPCHKNARWFADGDYERMGHERHDQSRVYARVEVPGRITVGDTVEVRRPQ